MHLDFAERYNARERKWFQRGDNFVLSAWCSVVFVVPSTEHHALQCLELLPRVRLGIHLSMDLGDAALLVDEVGDAAGVFVAWTAGGAVGQADFPVGVTEQRKGEVVLLGEAGVVFYGVEADAEDLRVLRFVLLGQVPEPGTLGRST